MSDNQPTLLPEEKPEEKSVAEDLEAYKSFLSHDRYRNQITVTNTDLISSFRNAAEYMEDLHQKQLRQVQERLGTTDGKLSRTVHFQISAIVNRYLQKIETANPQLAGQLKQAIEQAGKIERLAERMSEEVRQTRTQGNIRFVETLGTARKKQA